MYHTIDLYRDHTGSVLHVAAVGGLEELPIFFGGIPYYEYSIMGPETLF